MLELPKKAMEAVKVFGFGFERERGYVDVRTTQRMERESGAACNYGGCLVLGKRKESGEFS